MKSLSVWLLILAITPAAWADHARDHVCLKNVPGRLDNRYTINVDTVSDRVTGLTWQRCPLGVGIIKSTNQCDQLNVDTPKHTWQEALQKRDATDAIAKDPAWRVPNVKELLSLVELNCSAPMLDLKAFPFSEYVLWTSTPNTALVGYRITSSTSIPTNPTVGLVPVTENITRFHRAYYVNFSEGKPDLAPIIDPTATACPDPNIECRYAVLLVRDTKP